MLPRVREGEDVKEQPEPVVVIDTREPSPDHDKDEALFRPSIMVKGQLFELASERRKLDAGDYSLAGLESVVAFERKTLGDLLGTLVGTGKDSVGERAANIDRFRAELERLQGYAYRRIVVEGVPRAIYDEAAKPGRRFNPYAVLSMIWAIDVDYGVPVLWAGNRAGAELLVGSTLARIWEQHTGGDAHKKAAARGYVGRLPWARVEPTVGAREAVARVALGREAAREVVDVGTKSEAKPAESLKSTPVDVGNSVDGPGLVKVEVEAPGVGERALRKAIARRAEEGGEGRGKAWEFKAQ